jgi:hypothetical protein
MLHVVNRMRTAVAAAIVAALMCAGIGFAAQPASASQCVRSGCDLFAWGPGNGYFFTTPGYATVGMICWKDSVWYAGTNRWFFVSTIFGNGRAWVSANQVLNQTRVGHC